MLASTTDLIIGLVAPLGTDLDQYIEPLSVAFENLDYKPNEINLTDWLTKQFTAPRFNSYFEEVSWKIDKGNEIRKSGNNAVFAEYAIYQIRQFESQRSSNVPTVHIIRQFKRPEEIERMKEIFGDQFLLLGVNTSKRDRKSYLTNVKNICSDEADTLITRDEKEDGNKLGQRMEDTFQLADVFVSNDLIDNQINRFVDLVFSNPFQTPTPDEYFMFLAYASSLRSSDLSRQVGAVIVSPEKDLIAAGCNEVPSPGGGNYWPGDPFDKRDFQLGRDFNHERREMIYDEICEKHHQNIISLLHKLEKDLKLDNGSNGAITEIIENYNSKDFKKSIDETSLRDLTEYGRPVHAEMNAIISSARIGIGTKGSVLYCTTFPCHNCTKHIIAAGITKVIYIEPYPKSLAGYLHKDALDSDNPTQVEFRPFVGVSPVRYSDLFATNLKRLGKTIERKDKETGKKLLYSGDKKTFRYKRHGSEAEKKSIGNIEAKIKDIEGREITKANNEFKEGEKEYLDSRSAVKINRADEET